MRTAAIAGMGMYVPEQVVTNQFFDKLYKKDLGSFLVSQRNIRERRWMSEFQSTSDLALPAANEALKKAGITAQDLDLIIVATDTPDYMSPSTASILQYKLGATNAGTFDLNAACAGFVSACDTASKYIMADARYNNILVVGAYSISKYLDFKDYKVASIFADGAGAAVIQASQSGHGFLASELYTEGFYHDHMGIYDSLLAFPKRIPPETNGLHWPRMTRNLLERLNKTPQDVAHFFITQFNVQSIYETLDRLEVPREKAHYIMDRFGYTGSASVGMALADACHQGKLKKGDLIVMLGSGGGLSMAATALEWNYDT
ncbi:ketoacyl-ACP synthase III [Bdellovibrio sp. HCB337]|uniref:ketoacyl-ACP synthase III n=1 Tax=Bdellovibrio sp. HCB337 TaxID=3394358 RepID=UPI0039A5B205